MPGVEIVTFGCRLNAAESEIIGLVAGVARGRETGRETVIVNTCAVTAEAERQARQAIRRARREHPGAEIIVTGCAATIAPGRYRALPEVDRVLDNTAKLLASSYGAAATVAVEPAAVARVVASGRARDYLQVQQGCDHRCTFCIIPYGRGPSRSVPIGAIAERARGLVAAGTREIVLTGVDLTAYGGDLPGRPSLGQMARRLLAAVPQLERLRLSSLDPAEIDDELWALFGSEPRLMPHLHFSLQAGDDMILRRMKRRHRRADALAAARRARALRPEAALGADLIAGFPTETEDMFRRSLDLVAECGLAFVHVFPYSARPGTPAARMPAVAPELVRERAARLRAAASSALAGELGARIGSASDVLVERPGSGRTAFYARVDFAPAAFAPAAMPGMICRMRFADAGAERLIGEPVAP